MFPQEKTTRAQAKERESAEFVWDKDVWEGTLRSVDVTIYSGE